MNEKNETIFHLEVLNQEFRSRSASNCRYSLRNFAADLCVDASALSKILAGKQDLAPSYCMRILRRLELPQEVKREFLRSAIDERSRKEFVRASRQIFSQDQNPGDQNEIEPEIDICSLSATRN